MVEPSRKFDSAGGGLTVLAVDAERASLDDLVQLLESDPRIRSVVSAGSAEEAAHHLGELGFDAVFADIRIFGGDGLDLARVLSAGSTPPALVLVSESERHAVEAFEMRAVDYLLKPVRPERLAAAVGRLSGTPLSHPAPAEPPARVAVGVAGSTRFVERDAILFVETAGDYVRLQTADGAYLVRTPLASLEAAWAPAFVRVHRRYLVALRHLDELRPLPAGGAVIRVGGSELPVSRRRTGELRERLRRR